MTKEQWIGLIRHILTALGGYFVAKGILEEGIMMEIIAGIITVVGAVWSMLAPEKKAAKKARDNG